MSASKPPDGLPTRIGGVDVLNWNPIRVQDSGASRQVNNFGDLLGPMLVERMVDPRVSLVTEGVEPHVLLSVGSILHFAPEGATVWGTGINFKVWRPVPPSVRTLDIRAVRGPLTARTLAAAGVCVPAVFGDPGLLLPRYVPEMTAWSRLTGPEVLVVPNLNDYASMSARAIELGLKVLDPRSPMTHVLRTIVSAGLVIGSSLHAIVVADSVGVPARLIASSAEHVFKYLDYLAGSGRPSTVVATDIEDALRLNGHESPEVDLDELVNQFPHDLWSGPSRQSVPPGFRVRRSVLASWKAVLKQKPPSLQPEADRLGGTIVPALIHRAESVLDDMILGAPDLSAALEMYEADFEQASGVLEVVGDNLAEAASDTRVHDAIRAIRHGSSESLLRLVWLRRKGPHAVLRDLRRADNERAVIALSIRPGGLRNDLDSIVVRSLRDAGVCSERRIVVSPTQREQWSIDLVTDVEHSGRKDESGIRFEVMLVSARETIVLPLETPGDITASQFGHSQLGTRDSRVDLVGCLALQRRQTS